MIKVTFLKVYLLLCDWAEVLTIILRKGDEYFSAFILQQFTLGI